MYNIYKYIYTYNIYNMYNINVKKYIEDAFQNDATHAPARP